MKGTALRPRSNIQRFFAQEEARQGAQQRKEHMSKSDEALSQSRSLRHQE